MASAKQNRINRMVDILEHATSWVSASMLATMLGASERSIRNYVTEINGQGGTIIESSKEGYRLAHADEVLSSPACASIKSAPERGGEPTDGIGIDARCNYVASHLVNAR